MEEKDSKGDLIQITGMWKKIAKNGETYSTGRWGDVYVTLFKNKFKTRDEDPDFKLYISPVKSKRTPGEKDQGFQKLTTEGDDQTHG